MALVFPDVGENLVLEAIVNKTAPQDLVLKLFQNNVTPSEPSVAASFTEATFSGYAPIPLTGASWGAASAGTIANIQRTFTHDGGATANSIYGYYIVQATSGTLLFAERDASAPFLLQNSGDNIKVTPAITAD